ncbi:hypothetical protein HanRHA438_Chr01g0042291 [Helianthus annuus]|uniref:Uncharacterized protein n=1 Tax=Helianthus annuus TaxID=4232 RepID=A0A251VU62_HELAN|nr:hypothetical protein HanXRQr2_Chr01g0041431 [Helianthus annuus]KAJ0628416.1 hypothetical protein HanHA89_Chr01g0036331 [Helianthus annuus]KAJ0784691.1 hypothetical protein HanLR1_Chr01g0034711 [Helianthus annuus]KAJ0949778.1 hypothetical protein HanRHA438_Chr01g0042291 [Helianthus annuus]
MPQIPYIKTDHFSKTHETFPAPTLPNLRLQTLLLHLHPQSNDLATLRSSIFLSRSSSLALQTFSPLPYIETDH